MRTKTVHKIVEVKISWEALNPNLNLFVLKENQDIYNENNFFKVEPGDEIVWRA